jgi:hypothetical protein
LAVVLAGMVRDGFMAVLITSIIEVPGVGARWSGTAVGLVMMFAMLASVISPPLGNSLATIAPGLPFLFWSALGFMGVAVLAWRGQPKPALAQS